MENKKVIVLGAGITGLTTAWRLAQNGHDVTVIEKESHVGGLAGTMNWDGWKFDFGAHSFHTKNPEMAALYRKLLPDKFAALDITAKLFIFNKLIAYPLVGAHVFFVLDSMTMITAGLDFFLTRLKALLFGIKKTDRLDEWIIARFGRVLYEIYFSHYIERIQKHNPRDLSKDLGEKKIPIFSIRQYLRREILRKRDPRTDDVALLDYYYCKGGFGELPRYFYEAMPTNGKVKFNECVKNIMVKNGKIVTIETNKDSYACEDYSVISTIPLNDLIHSFQACETNVRNAGNELDSVKMRFLLMKVKKSKVMGYRWVNFSDVRFPFYRVSEYSYDKFEMVPENKCSLIFEIPLSPEDPLWTLDEKRLTDIILPLFNEVFELSHDDIIEVRSLRTHHASPVMALNYRESLGRVFDFIQNIQNLYSIGRQGLFTYINLDGCTQMGLDFADSLIKNNAKQKNGELLKSFHNI